MKLWRPRPTITLGRTPARFFPRGVKIPIDHARTHAHVIGVSEAGKSRFLAHLYMELVQAGFGVTLIDPHGDLAELTYASMVSRNLAMDRTIYLDLPAAERRGLYLPLNILNQDYSPDTIATNIKDAFHRMWPLLGEGRAPRFDRLVINGTKVLISNDLPLPYLEKFLTDQAFRAQLLTREQDQDVVALWQGWYDRLPDRLRIDYADSTLSRINLLTFTPILKHSLGHQELRLPFRKIMDEQFNVIINLAVDNDDAQKLLGSLLTVFYEKAAFARKGSTHRPGHMLMVDEFSEYSAQSEASLTKILSQARKYGLFLIMAHQYWSQASENLRGAMQNTRLEVAFQLGWEDATVTAPSLIRFDPEKVKPPPKDSDKDPPFDPLQEQREIAIQTLYDLPDRHALVRSKSGRVREIKTITVPDPSVDITSRRDAFIESYFEPAPSRETPEIERVRRINARQRI